MKRFLGFALVLTLLFSVLSACNSSVPTLMEFLAADSSRDSLDFGGAQIVCTGGWSYFDTKPDAEEEFNTINSDRRIYRTAQVEKALNVDIVQDWNVISEQSSYYYVLYVANNLSVDLALQFGTPNPIYDMYKSGMLEPLDNMPAIDLSDESVYGTADGRRAVTFDGLTYAYMGTSEDEGTDRGFLAYNDYLIKSFGVADPQELYEQGQWTFDTFAEMLPLVTDFSDAEFPTYGLTLYSDPQMLSFCAVFANGGQVVKQDASGKYVFALEDPVAIEALEWVSDLQATGNVVLESYPPSLFRKGQATFYLGRSWNIQNALEADSEVEEFYYIPFPYGPNGEYGVSAASYASEDGGVVFFNCSDTDMVGKVFDYWLRFDDYPDELAFDESEYALENNFWSQASYENYVRAEKVYEYDYFTQIGSELYYEFSKELHNATIGTTNFSTLFDSYSDVIQAALDESLNN